MLMDQLIMKMAEFDRGDAHRLQHNIKVYTFAHTIGLQEGLDSETLHILDIASILHDIGIRPAEEKYGHHEGYLQEKEGPFYAREMLKDFPEVTEAETERICFLIGHHHTYTGVEGLDWRILLEADFLVNSHESQESLEAIRTFEKNVFRTGTGKKLLETMYNFQA